MKTRITAATFAVAALLLPAASLRAQSSAIGFSGAELSATQLFNEGGGHSAVDASADFSITANHGFQLDIGVVDYGAVWFGNIAAHLYLQPSRKAKYGLFLAYSDANNAEAATTEAGVEGIWSLTPSTTFSARAGLGRADPSEIDYIFTDLAGSVALSDRLSFEAGALVLDADEAAAKYTLVEARFGLGYSFANAPVEVYLGANHSRLSGSIKSQETRVSLSLTVRFGQPRDARRPASQRSFAPVRPLRGLISRDMVWTASTWR